MAKKGFRPDVVTWSEINQSDLPPWADRTFHTWNLLSEGDSWFTMAGIPTSNLLFTMRFPVSTMIVNCALPGDTIKNISRIADNQGLKYGLSKQYGEKWDLIFLSGGGNDLIDAASAILIDPDKRGSKKKQKPEEYCDLDYLDNLIKKIQKGYRRIVELRDEADAPSRDVPIVCHTYDYPTANNSPARFGGFGLFGPWLYTAFQQDQIPKKDWVALADTMFEWLAKGLLELPDQLPNFHVVDTRNSIKRAKPDSRGESGDWLNEIHPNEKGYRKLSRKILKTAIPLIEANKT